MTLSGRRRMIGAAAFAVSLAVAACGKKSDAVAAADAFRPLEVGDSVPRFAGVTLAGASLEVAPGQPLTLVNVWATWCESCREEMADLEAIQRDYSKRGLRVLAVSVDNGDGARVRRFVENEHLTLPVIHDPGATVERIYSTVGVPESYLIDRHARLVWHVAGGLHADPAAARAAIDHALAQR